MCADCLPASCGYILDELLHAHFEDHDKDLYYGQIRSGSIIENGRRPLSSSGCAS